MPTDMTRYPADWKQFSAFIRFTRAKGQCECHGQCGLHQPARNTRRCTERHRHPAQHARGRVTLTTAHLCLCEPPCTNPDHVLALCQRCHLRIDAQWKANKRRARGDFGNPQAPQPPKPPQLPFEALP